MPKVSVMMPVYNAEKYIAEAVDSILKQSFEDFELVIVNDGSTDKSGEVVKKINDHRIRYYENERNMGAVYTRNRILELCKGEYLAPMDADDRAPRERLATEVKFLNENMGCDCVHGRTIIIDEDGNTIGDYGEALSDARYIKAKLFMCNVIANGSAMFRKKIVKKYHLYYKTKVIHDYGFWTEFSIYGTIRGIQDVMLFYRTVPTGLTGKSNQEMRDQIMDEIHNNMIEKYGIKLHSQEKECYFKATRENGRITSAEEIKNFYKACQRIIEHLKKEKMDFVLEFEKACQKQLKNTVFWT